MANDEATIRASFARQGMMSHLGAGLERVRDGEVVIGLPFRLELSQQHGYFHAGSVATVMDSAGGYAGLTRMREGATVLSVEFKVNLLAPADGDRLRATGRVVRSGRTLTVCALEAHVRQGDGWKHCATGMQTLICLPASERRPSG